MFASVRNVVINRAACLLSKCRVGLAAIGSGEKRFQIQKESKAKADLFCCVGWVVGKDTFYMCFCVALLPLASEIATCGLSDLDWGATDGMWTCPSADPETGRCEIISFSESIFEWIL